jgi:hypothetical protein
MDIAMVCAVPSKEPISEIAYIEVANGGDREVATAWQSFYWKNSST